MPSSQRTMVAQASACGLLAKSETQAEARATIPAKPPLAFEAGVTLIEMLIVVAIIAVIAGVSFPALTSGLASVRLSSASGSTASFLTATMNRVDRHELAAAVVITPKENQIDIFTAASGNKPENTLRMPQGISIEGDEARRFLLQPGGAFPRIALVLRNDKGARRSVHIDPATGVPEIRREDVVK